MLKSLPPQPARPGYEHGSELRLAVILASLNAFDPFATDMYLAGFPMLARSFQTDLVNIQIGLSIFFIGLAVGQLIYGPLIDRYGRKPPLLAGVSLFACASLLITAAPTVESFIALRFLQAVGGAAGMIVSRAIIADMFTPPEAARVLSLMMMVQSLGPILAPVLGGYIVASLGWRTVFLFLTLFGLACLLAVKWGLPETLSFDQRRQERIADIFGVWLRLMTSRTFILPALTCSFVFAGLFAFITASPFVYMQLHGVSERNYGWLFGINALGLILAAQMNRILLRQLTAATLVRAGLIVMTIGALILTGVSATTSLTQLVILLLICLANVPLIGANTVALAMAATGHHRGSGSAIIGLLQFGVAGAVSICVSLLQDETARPMCWIILASAIIASICWYSLQKVVR